MNRFFGKTARTVTPYTPGEQPRDRRYIKLNTNECPYPPSPTITKLLQTRSIDDLRLYPDPTAKALRQAMADSYGLAVEQVFAGGGSDEILAYAFMAFFSEGDSVYYPDITYGFYKVYADLFRLTSKTIPLKDDFSIAISDYFGLDGHIFIANPNAPTGICLSVKDMEEILKNNPNQLVVVDEAYIDFATNQTCVPLINTYDNLLVVQTFSKSRALAGMRLGFAFGNPELLDGLERMKYSFNPFNIDQISVDVGIATIQDDLYFKELVGKINTTRDHVANELTKLRYQVVPSQTNFLFVRHPLVSGEVLYQYLRENGLLIRYFPGERTGQYVRITIGTNEEMNTLLELLAAFKEESYE